MKKIFIILTALSLVLAGCGKIHDPSSTTQETEYNGMEAVITDVTYNMEASLIRSEQQDGQYVYTVFVGANDAYAKLADDCVYYLTDTYQPIAEVVDGVEIQVLNVNDTSTQDTAAFINIVAPQILDIQKVFIYAFGTTQYEDGMTFESVDKYCEQYDKNTLVSIYLQITQHTFNMDTLYQSTRPVYESIRLLNWGSGYDVIIMSTKNTKAYLEDGTLWTPIDITTFAGTDYSEMFADLLINAYVASGDVQGGYQDIVLHPESPCSITVRTNEGIVEVGLTNYENEDNTPNCVVGNLIVSDGITTITESEGQRAIILFFN